MSLAGHCPDALGRTVAVLKQGRGGGGALESKMESSGRAGGEKSLCGNGLLQGSISPAPATQLGF